MPATIVELDAIALKTDPTMEPRVNVDPDRLRSNQLRMAKCLTHYDLRKNCVHIHD